MSPTSMIKQTIECLLYCYPAIQQERERNCRKQRKVCYNKVVHGRERCHHDRKRRMLTTNIESASFTDSVFVSHHCHETKQWRKSV